MGDHTTLYHLWFGELAAERLPRVGSIETEPQVSKGPLRGDYLLLHLEAAEGAYASVVGALFPIWVVSLDELAREEGEPLLTFFARGKLDAGAKEARRWMRTRMSRTDTTNLSELEGFEEALEALLHDLPPEKRVEGLTPEERMRGLAPEERLLTLPVEALRALAPEYVDSLPEPIRAEIRRRTGAG